MAQTNKRRDVERRTAAARKVEEMRLAQQAAERRRRVIVVSLSVLAVLAAVIVTAIVVQNSRTQPSAPAAGVPGTTANYGVLVGQPSAPVHVVVYEDFQCPFCRQFESASSATLQQYVADKRVSVEYRPIAFLDQSSTTQYSTRSLNAAACVTADGGSDAFLKFHDLLYANQPAEGSAGLPNSQLIQYARQAGVSGPQVQSCINNEQYRGWTVGATDASSKAGVTGTPTILINGKAFPDISSKQALVHAINSAGNAG
jgi:protein-disulfide isomerase